ncbi:MAG: CARDB domain-containing protein [bacterium]
MKNRTIFLVLFMFAAFAAAFFCTKTVFAQNDALSVQDTSGGQITLIATVNIYNARIISQTGNNFRIGFEIYNREKIQPDIRYGIRLTKDNKIIDEKNYAEALTLGKEELVKKEVEYSAPAYLKGSFEIWVVSANSRGLPLGINTAGSVSLSGDSQFVEILADSCYLAIEGQEAEHHLFSEGGLIVQNGQKIIGNCKAVSYFKEEINFVPQVETYAGNSKELIENGKTSGSGISIKPQEQKIISFYVPQGNASQIYQSKITLVKNETQISNAVSFFHGLEGTAGTIMNVLADKDYYSPGENAEISVFWNSFSIQVNSNAENGAAPPGNVLFDVSIKNENGRNCVDPISAESKTDKTSAKFNLSITSECLNPQLAVSLKDASGKILDAWNFAITSKNPPQAKPGSLKLDSSSAVLILVALCVLGLAAFFFFRKKSVNAAAPVILFLIVAGGMFFFSAGAAEAYTGYVGGSMMTYFTANLTKTSFDLNEMIMWTTDSYTSNSTSWSGPLWLRINAQHNSGAGGGHILLWDEIGVAAYSSDTAHVGGSGSIIGSPLCTYGVTTNVVSIQITGKRIFSDGTTNEHVGGDLVYINCSTLNVLKAGNCTGTVSGTGISCGSDCKEDFTADINVTLTATPSAGCVFAGWSGAGCSGTGVCNLALTYVTPVNVTATFNKVIKYKCSGTSCISDNGDGSGSFPTNACGTGCLVPKSDMTASMSCPSNPAAGSSVGFSGTITNSGNAAANSASNPRICIDNTNCMAGSTSGSLGDGWTNAIGPGVSEGVSGSWTAITGSHTATVCADAWNHVTNESNESNNCSTCSFSVSGGPSPYCGDGTCNGTESCSSCPGDCGACVTPSCTIVGFSATPSSGTAPLSGVTFSVTNIASTGGLPVCYLYCDKNLSNIVYTSSYKTCPIGYGTCVNFSPPAGVCNSTYANAGNYEPRVYCTGNSTCEATTPVTVSAGAIPAPPADASCPVGQVFTNYQSLGGVGLFEAVIGVTSAGRLIMVVPGAANAIYANEWQGGSPTGWYYINGNTGARPKLVNIGGVVWAYVQGLDGYIYKSAYQSPWSWSSWQGTGIANANFGSAGPSAVSVSGTAYKVAGTNPIMLQNCVACTVGCGSCSVACGGGTQSCTAADCSIYSQACNTQACTLSVSLTAIPTFGTAPLSSTLTATVGGTAFGTINYTFWKNCSSACSTVQSCTTACGSYDAKYDGRPETSYSSNISYAAGGGYTPKVVVERGSASPVQAMAWVSVFNPLTSTLTVLKTGTGTGTVTSVDTKINCGGDCSEVYNFGNTTTLNAAPASGSTFAGWSGAGCSGTGSCIVTMDASKTVTARFTAPVNWKEVAP